MPRLCRSIISQSHESSSWCRVVQMIQSCSDLWGFFYTTCETKLYENKERNPTHPVVWQDSHSINHSIVVRRQASQDWKTDRKLLLLTLDAFLLTMVVNSGCLRYSSLSVWGFFLLFSCLPHPCSTSWLFSQNYCLLGFILWAAAVWLANWIISWMNKFNNVRLCKWLETSANLSNCFLLTPHIRLWSPPWKRSLSFIGHLMMCLDFLMTLWLLLVLPFSWLFSSNTVKALHDACFQALPRPRLMCQFTLLIFTRHVIFFFLRVYLKALSLCTIWFEFARKKRFYSNFIFKIYSRLCLFIHKKLNHFRVLPWIHIGLDTAIDIVINIL